MNDKLDRNTEIENCSDPAYAAAVLDELDVLRHRCNEYETRLTLSKGEAKLLFDRLVSQYVPKDNYFEFSALMSKIRAYIS